MVSSRNAVSRLATTAAPTPKLISRLRCEAPIFDRKVIRAPTMRIASRPSLSMITNDWTKRLTGDNSSPRARSAFSSATASRLSIGLSSAGEAEPEPALVLSAEKAASTSPAMSGFLARSVRSTCSNVM